jgi:hypothetical protein
MDKKISRKSIDPEGEFMGLEGSEKDFPRSGAKKRGQVFCCLEEVKLLYII